jgi:hypothetical protein
VYFGSSSTTAGALMFSSGSVSLAYGGGCSSMG